MMRALRSAAFMLPRDIGLFLRSAQTDRMIARTRTAFDDKTAFDMAYAEPDPWASTDQRYRYQRRKYAQLLGFLPSGRRFGRALDIGSGLGSMCRLVAMRADEVIGVDISQNAVDRAQGLHAAAGNVRFVQGDIRGLDASAHGVFDLVILADVIYYLPRPITDERLKAIALQVSALLAPGGICLLANHFFFDADADSRLSRRIHRAFAWSPAFSVVSEHRRPFYLASVLAGGGPG